MKRRPSRKPVATPAPPAPLELGRAHAFLAAQNAFTSFLDIPCSLVTRTGSWIVVYNSPGSSVVEAQSALGGRAARGVYNQRHVEQVLSSQQPLETELHGFTDLWVPIVSGGRCDNLLVSGPLLRQSWTADDIRRSWLELTGERPPPQSRQFLEYARTVLRTQVLGDGELEKFQEFLRAFAELLAGRGEEQKYAQKFWHQARRDFSRLPSAQLRKGALVVDPVSSWTWAEGMREWDAEELGIDALPTEVLAVLPAQTSAAEDTLDLLVRAERFQIECVALARQLPSTMAARLEDTGVLLLTHVDPRLSRTQRRLKLRERAEQVQTFVSRRLGTAAFIGIGESAERVPDLHRSAREAVFAVELCVHREQPLCFYRDEISKTPSKAPQAEPAARLASHLLELFGRAEPALLEVSRMDYVRGVLSDAAGRASVMRVHFEHALFALLALVEKSAQLDAKTVGELEARLSESLGSSLTTVELITVFRQWFDSLLKLMSEPYAEARRLRLERAQKFIADHCTGPLSLGQVARHAGLSRSYFSRIFKETFGKGFEHYLTEQRLLLAERLLRGSALPIGRISGETGFATAAHFSAAFRRSRGVSPLSYRRSHGSPAAGRAAKSNHRQTDS
ncbi:MAG TPA: helix-turn-helix domain-containing protein [Polyangiaceae bacterium]|nr:helix-turn-helix domain-containing protein [Polyangiaceae bacterium]